MQNGCESFSYMLSFRFCLGAQNIVHALLSCGFPGLDMPFSSTVWLKSFCRRQKETLFCFTCPAVKRGDMQTLVGSF